MRITEKQEQFLQSLTCQRLTADPRNRDLIPYFDNHFGYPLVNKLQVEAWEEDKAGTTAYYLIKTPDNKILLYFSIKCGALFHPLDRQQLETVVSYIRDRMRGRKPSISQEDQEDAQNYINYLAGVYNTSPARAEYIVLEMHKSLLADERREPNKLISRVNKTYPSVELAHFCVNEMARGYWKSSGIRRPMGEVLFWYFIAPILCSIQDTVGCEFAHLFAADFSRTRALVAYYETSLRFFHPDYLGTSKPSYDFVCEFLCQKIEKMRARRVRYLDNFNPDPDEDAV